MSGQAQRTRTRWLITACAAAACLALPAGASGTTFNAAPDSLGAIPDGTSPSPGNYGAARDVSFNVSGLGADGGVTGIALTFRSNHTWVGDLDAVLISPDPDGPIVAQQITLFSRTGADSGTSVGDSSNLDGPYTFTDTAPASPSWWDTASAATGTDSTISDGVYRASTAGPTGGASHSMLVAFLPITDPNGTWTLRVRDGASGDIGSITSASLAITGSVVANPSSVGDIADGEISGYGAPRDVTFPVDGLPTAAPGDVTVSMTMNHTWVGDLNAALIAPNAAPATIFSRTGATAPTQLGDSSDLIGTYRFYDAAQAGTSWWTAAQNAATSNDIVAPGDYRPSTPGEVAGGGAPATITDKFSGVTNPNGTWTLRLRDHGPGDQGSISGATLRVLPGTDATAPDPPTLTGTAPSSPAPSATPKVQGTAEAGSFVRLYANDPFCSSAPAATGTASQLSGPGITLPVGASDGVTSIHATAYDLSGNDSGCSAVIGYTKDATAPATPTITGTDPLSPANNNDPKLKGTGAENGSTVRVYDNPTCAEPAAASGDAADFNGAGVTINGVPDDDAVTLRVAARDAAGNFSGCSDPITYVEDSTSGTPTITGTDPPSPANNNSPKLKGNGADADATVYVYAGAACTGVANYTAPAADFSGAGIPVAVADNMSQTFVVEAYDVAGNGSACSTPFTYREDSIAPAAATLAGTDPPSGSNENAPKVTGSAEAGSAVTLFATADCSGSPAATGSAANLADSGITLSVDDNSTTQISAAVTDAAGNAAACSAPISYAEVTPPLLLPDLAPPDTAIDSAPKAKVKTKGKKAAFSIAFSANEPATFQCSLDGAALKPCASPETGKAKKGSHTFSVIATDAAGNADPTPATATWKVKRKKRH